MNCKNCGYQLSPEDKFCIGCGSPVGTLENKIEHTILNLEPITDTQPRAITENQEPELPQPMKHNPEPALKTNEFEIPTPVNQKEDLSIEKPMISPATPQPINTPITNEPLIKTPPEPTLTKEIPATPLQPTQPTPPIPPINPNPNPIPTPPHVTSVPPNAINNTPLLIGIILLILFTVGAFFVGKSMGTTNNCPEETNNNDTNNNTANQTPTPTPTASNYKISYRGFDLNIPVDYEYQIQDDILVIYNNAITWIAEITIEDIMYANIVTGKDDLKNYFDTSGLIVNNYGEKRLGSTTYLTFEITKDPDKYIFAYAQANSKYTFGIAAYNKTNTIDYDILSNISTIISSATYVDRSKSTSINNKVTFPDVNKIIK